MQRGSTITRQAVPAALLLLAALPLNVPAQDAYPTRPIRIIVPSTPGGGSDISNRMMYKETVGYLRKPEAVEYLARDSNIVVASSPDEFAAFIKAEIAKWANVVKAAGMQPE